MIHNIGKQSFEIPEEKGSKIWLHWLTIGAYDN